jgi:hypothetical protein
VGADRVGVVAPTAAEVCGKRGSRPEEAVEELAVVEELGAEAQVPGQEQELEEAPEAEEGAAE